jgi:N-acetylneuraminate lyase
MTIIPENFRIIAAPHTPFASDGALRLDVVPQQAKHLAETGVDGVFVGGTTGEGSSLTSDERRALAHAWCKATQSVDLDVIIQVGHTCQRDARELAAHAQQLGADAIAAHAPNYFKPNSVDALIDFLAPVAESASDLPFYFYDIPGMTHVTLPMKELLDRGKSRIPNLVGLKYSNLDAVQLQECVQFGEGDFELLFGCDEALLSGIALGVRGAVGSTYNFVAPLYRRLLAALEAGDYSTARRLQYQSVEIVRTLQRYDFLPASKAVLELVGIDCGPVRSPLNNLSSSARKSLLAEFRSRRLLEVPETIRAASRG